MLAVLSLLHKINHKNFKHPRRSQGKGPWRPEFWCFPTKNGSKWTYQDLTPHQIKPKWIPPDTRGWCAAWVGRSSPPRRLQHVPNLQCLAPNGKPGDAIFFGGTKLVASHEALHLHIWNLGAEDAWKKFRFWKVQIESYFDLNFTSQKDAANLLGNWGHHHTLGAKLFRLHQHLLANPQTYWTDLLRTQRDPPSFRNDRPRCKTRWRCSRSDSPSSRPPAVLSDGFGWPKTRDAGHLHEGILGWMLWSL